MPSGPKSIHGNVGDTRAGQPLFILEVLIHK